jgi:hypothetical protein
LYIFDKREKGQEEKNTTYEKIDRLHNINALWITKEKELKKCKKRQQQKQY